VNASGFPIIPWPPRTDGLPLELDALLATATDPTIVDGQYPSVQEIASAWKQSTGVHVEYFWRNRECGITTFQDNEIEKHLNESRSA
jgi:hypothetical protein